MKCIHCKIEKLWFFYTGDDISWAGWLFACDAVIRCRETHIWGGLSQGSSNRKASTISTKAGRHSQESWRMKVCREQWENEGLYQKLNQVKGVHNPRVSAQLYISLFFPYYHIVSTCQFSSFSEDSINLANAIMGVKHFFIKHFFLFLGFGIFSQPCMPLAAVWIDFRLSMPFKRDLASYMWRQTDQWGRNISSTSPFTFDQGFWCIQGLWESRKVLIL